MEYAYFALASDTNFWTLLTPTPSGENECGGGRPASVGMAKQSIRSDNVLVANLCLHGAVIIGGMIRRLSFGPGT